MPSISFHSPLGMLTLSEEDGVLVSLDWGQAPKNESTPLLENGRRQIDEYFDGVRTVFDLALDPHGTVFQQKVWKALQAIPYGCVQSYKDVALAVGSGPRAIGGACGRNPLPIIIPCHRVVASNGAMCGYSGMDGVDTKQYLIDLEKENLETNS